MLSSEDLRFFCQVVSHSSLAATARALNVTPPSVTQRLQAIEGKLGLPLIIRQGRAITLTDEGQLLAERGRLILAEMEDLHDSLHDRKHALVGRLKILAPLDSATNTLPLWLQLSRPSTRTWRSNWSFRTNRTAPGWPVGTS